MSEGFKVTHKYFLSDEYIYIPEGSSTIMTDDDYSFDGTFNDPDFYPNDNDWFIFSFKNFNK
jgi:hypothetical protein